MPIALAPGMGLNAFVAFQVAPAAGGWQGAMGLIVLDGAIVLACVLLGLREAVARAIPVDLRRAIGVGIGLFIIFLGLVQAQIVVVPASTVAALSEHPGLTLPPVTAGDWSAPGPLIAIVGFIAGACLLALGRAGAMLVAIAVSALLAIQTGYMAWNGTIVAWPRFDTVFQADVRAALDWRLLPLLFSLVLVDFFDTVGTVTAIGEAAGLTGRDGMMPRFKQILAIDAIAAMIGGAAGASSATSYVESAAGVAEGARTGLHSVFVGLLFLASMALAPIAAAVPAVATAPALILTGLLMCRDIGPHRRRPARHRAPGVPHRDHGAADVLDLARHRRRLHRLRRHQGAERAHPRGAPADGGLRRHLHPLLRAGVAGAATARQLRRLRYFSTPKRNTVCDR